MLAEIHHNRAFPRVEVDVFALEIRQEHFTRKLDIPACLSRIFFVQNPCSVLLRTRHDALEILNLSVPVNTLGFLPGLACGNYPKSCPNLFSCSRYKAHLRILGFECSLSGFPFNLGAIFTVAPSSSSSSANSLALNVANT